MCALDATAIVAAQLKRKPVMHIHLVSDLQVLPQESSVDCSLLPLFLTTRLAPQVAGPLLHLPASGNRRFLSLTVPERIADLRATDSARDASISLGASAEFRCFGPCARPSSAHSENQTNALYDGE